MYSLQRLLTILGGQKLSPGYLTPSGNNTALETVLHLMSQFSYYVILQNPIPYPALLVTPAWIGSLGVGRDAIFLNGVDGNLDLSHAGPAYIFTQPV
jgi:hypothetical protein